MLRFLYLSAAVILVGCSDTLTSRYSNYAEAETNGAVKRGWIPRVLPASTKQIEELHDLDINIGQGTFVFSKSDSEKFKNQLAPLPMDGTFRRVRINRKDLERKGYAFYTFEDFYLAINWQKSDGYFWIDYVRPN